MGRKAVTIRDVAKRAGVGISTVSYVLNGDADHVSEATREVILSAVRELQYRPNAIARSMVRRKTATIALIITELQNPLFIPVMEGVEAVLRNEGYHILLASANDAQSERNAIEMMRMQQVDGFIIMSLSMRFPLDHLIALQDAGIPCVVINRDLDADTINQIRFDDYGAGRMAAQYLRGLNHQRCAIITGPMGEESEDWRRSAVERYEGWRDTFEAVMPTDEWVFDGGYTFEDGYQAAHQLIKQLGRSDAPPTACFVSNDVMAVGALKAFHEARIVVPNDLALVTIGDPPFAPYTIPALTTLELPVVEAGRIAAQILIDTLKAEDSLEPQAVTLGFKLRIRESCGGRADPR